MSYIRNIKDKFRRLKNNRSEAHSRAMETELKRIKEDRQIKQREASLINEKKLEQKKLSTANAIVRGNSTVGRAATNMAKFLNKQKKKSKGRDVFGESKTKSPFSTSGSKFEYGGKGKSPFK